MREILPRSTSSVTQTPVVGIVVSAGGLNAIAALMQKVGSQTGASYVVIQQAPDASAQLNCDQLAEQVGLPVKPAQDNADLEADTLHLVPLGQAATLENRRLRLGEAGRGKSGAIDTFFESMAEQLGPAAIGIFLANAGADGLRGTLRIKEAGGTVVAQDPGTIELAPLSAPIADPASYERVLAPAEIADWLCQRIQLIKADAALPKASTARHEPSSEPSPHSYRSELDQNILQLQLLDPEYDHTLRSMGDVSVLNLDTNQRLQSFNASAATAFSLNDADAGLPLEKFANRLQKPKKFLRRIQGVQSEHAPASFEIREHSGNSFLIRAFPRNNGATGTIVTFSNITGIKEAQARIETAVSISKIVWWEWHIGLNLVHTFCHEGPRFDCILGYNADNIPNTKDSWLEATHPDDLKYVVDSLAEHLQSHSKHWICEHRYRNVEGDYVWVRNSGEVIQRDEHGNAVTMVGTTQNIHERKTLELQLKEHVHENERLLARAREHSREMEELAYRAESANRAKGQFLAMMSHEIRTPLNAIIGYSELLMNRDLTDGVKEYVGPIAEAGKSLMSVIGDILDYSKLESSALELEPSPFSLKDLLKRATSSVPPKPNVTQVKRILDGDLRPQSEATWVVGDADRICQVLVNLIGNAVKFTPEGEVTTTAKVEPVDGRTVDITFSVADQGIGIPDELQKRIFEPFTQADASINRRHGGTGLGLSISQAIVKAMGSQIEVYSETGKGSVFTFSLRLPVYGIDSTLGVRNRRYRPRALVIDDKPASRSLLSGLLSSLQVDTNTADNAREGIEALLGQSFDVVFVAVANESEDGIETAKSIRSRSEASLQRLPIVAVGPSELHGRCKEAGIDDIVPTPPTLSRLKGVLAKQVSPGA